MSSGRLRIYTVGRVSFCVCRFEVWPYLEEFTVNVAKALVEEMGTKPDFVIGNYRLLRFTERLRGLDLHRSVQVLIFMSALEVTP